MKRFVDGLCWTLMAISGLLLALSLAIPKALAQDDGWPRTLRVGEGLVTIYPLQVDGMENDVLRYRSALAWRETPGAEPVFGAGWFESRVSIDRDQRVVHPLDLRVTGTRFPAGTDDLQPALAAALDDAMAGSAPGWNLDFSLDRLDAALASARAEAESLQQLNTSPPQIVYRDRPALLVTFDGEPVVRPIEDSAYQAVINTPYPLISDGKRYYLNVAKGAWYRADAALGPYRFDPAPPAAIASLVKPEEAATADADAAADGPAHEPITSANAPEIVVTTQPTELIVTDGPAAFVPLVDDLLVLNNSDDDVFMHVGTQRYYIVLAGRWYHAPSLDGPWEYQAADALPPAFADIPLNSDQADSRVYVAGTPEAEEAVLDAQVPQTAAVERGQADVDVAYDGEPEFAPVDGTELEYARNTGSTVLQSNRTYYLVEDGVWYVSQSPNGPWQVADHRPAAVDAIRPSSPVYNVKYVYVYDSTPDVVYVGYTPGYLGSFVYYNTVVYGTGWYYRPWVSPRYYYPRFRTWGFHVGYDPWYGWSYGLSWNWGWGSVWIGDYPWGWGPYYTTWYTGGYWHHHHHWYDRYYGYWGPRGYWPRPYYPAYRYGYSRYAYRDVYYGRDRYSGRYAAGRDYGDGYRDRGRDGRGYGGNRPGRHPNLYRDAGQRARIANTWDKLPRERSLDGSKAAKVNNLARQGYSGKAAYAKSASQARYRSEPVKAGDLLTKARVRDANAEASRKLMLADNQGKVYRKPAARVSAKAAYGDVSKSAEGAVSAKAPQRAERIKGSAAQDRAATKAPTASEVLKARTQAQADPAASRKSGAITKSELNSAWKGAREARGPQQQADTRARQAEPGIKAVPEKAPPRTGTATRNATRASERQAAPKARTQERPMQKSAPMRVEKAQKSSPAPVERAPKAAPSRLEKAPVQPAPRERAAPARREAAPQPRSMPEPNRRDIQAAQTRNTAPAPQRNSAPPPQRNSAPPPQRNSAPPPQRSSAPPPQRNSAPPPSGKRQSASRQGSRDRGERGGSRRD